MCLGGEAGVLDGIYGPFFNAQTFAPVDLKPSALRDFLRILPIATNSSLVCIPSNPTLASAVEL
jgi:hypothetical protein